jgi:hypothetical protein
VTSAAIYARVSSARQTKDQTIGSQTAALRDRAGQLGAELPEEWVFEDEGHSAATLVRPALERLRAHAILVIIWHVVATGRPYDELGADYFIRRLDPDRETRRLIAKLEALGHQVSLRPAA